MDLPSHLELKDAMMAPKNRRSTVLSIEQDAGCIAFLRHTLLPLDDLPLRTTALDTDADAMLAASFVPAARYQPACERS